MTYDNPNGCLRGEEWSGVTPVVLGGHYATVVEMEVEGTPRVAMTIGGGGWAESRPLPSIVVGDHRDMCGVWGRGKIQ